MASGFVELSIVVAPVLVYEDAHLSLALDIATDANFKARKHFKMMPIKWHLHKHDGCIDIRNSLVVLPALYVGIPSYLPPDKLSTTQM